MHIKCLTNILIHYTTLITWKIVYISSFTHLRDRDNPLKDIIMAVNMVCVFKHGMCTLANCQTITLSMKAVLDRQMIDDSLYSAILRSLEQTHCTRMWFYMSDQLFITHFFNMHRSGVLTVLTWLVPHETTAVLAQVLCTPYNHAPCHHAKPHT